jgi:hypothetical protein
MILILWAASAGLRWFTYRPDLIATNIAASDHVLLTIRALDETPASVHHFLPIATLGRPLDRQVPFGASIASHDGIMYYTSFSSLGFVMPWAFFKTTALAGFGPSERGLMVFNFGILLAAALLLGLLIAELFELTDPDREIDDTLRRTVTALAAVTYLFSREALYSHGVIYWHHSPFQVVWLAQLVAVCRAMRATNSGTPVPVTTIGVLIVTAFVAPFLEWTGYFATTASAFVLAACSRSWRLPAAMIGAMALALAAFVGQYLSVLGFTPLVAALAERAGARSVVHASAMGLAMGYVESYGVPLLVLAALSAVILFFTLRGPSRRAPRLLLVAVLVPLLENAVLAAHATDYTFDRLKALIAIIVLIVLALSSVRRMTRERLVFAWMIVAALILMRPTMTRYHDAVPPIRSNVAFLSQLRASARPCAVFGTDAEPGAGVDISLDANVYSDISTDSLAHVAARRGACQAIYMKASVNAGEGLYIWRAATLLDLASGRVDTIAGTERRKPKLTAVTAQ